MRISTAWPAIFTEIQNNAGGPLTNDDILLALFGELGLDVNQAESAYQAWARSQ